MASGRKQKTINELLMMKPGLRAQIPDSPSLSLTRGSPMCEPKHYLNAGYENTENIKHPSHDYEDLEHYNQIPSCPRKTNNAIYQQSSSPPATKRQRQFTECSDDSTSSLMHSSSKDSMVNKVVLGLILLMSLTALVLVILMQVGVVNPKCGCTDEKTVSEGTKHLTKINQPYFSTTLLFQKINGLEKNISSLLARDVIMTSLVVKHQKEILELKSKLSDVREGQQDISHQNNFKQNITTEVRQLREKQVHLDSSLNNLKQKDQTRSTDIQEMSAKVVGLAVAVTFLGTNDSLIKSKVNDLSLAQRKFALSLESLQRKDVALVTALERAKSVRAFLNASVNQLKSVDGQLETKMVQLNTTFMTKINKVNGAINGMQGRPGSRGPPSPPGAGNLSQCYHKQNKFVGFSDSTSDYNVNFIEPKDKIVVGATCSTVRGDETNLSSGTNSKGEKVYSCQCKGQSNVHNDSGNLKCFIDVWVCPKTS